MANYIDNKQFHKQMLAYKIDCNNAEAAGNPSPRIPPEIGESIMKIATHLASKPNFANYPFIEEMISDGIENSLTYIHNFDPFKYKNPFAYFTTIIKFAFIRRIQKEKRYLYGKHVATQIAEVTNITAEVQGHDRGKYRADSMHGEWSQEQMQRFMEDFEQSRLRKKKKKGKIEKDTKENP